MVPASVHRHRLPADHCVKSKPVLGGLHHEYRLEREAALSQIEFLRSTAWRAGALPREHSRCESRAAFSLGI